MARINDEIIERLNGQIALELTSSQQYLAMATYLAGRSLEFLAGFFFRQAEEERAHALKIIHYLLEVGGQPRVPELPAPRADFDNITELVKSSLEQERKVTDAIHQIVDAARDQRDYASVHFLQWFVHEQVEEEGTFAKLLDVIDMSQNVLQVEHYVRHVMGEAS